MRHLCSAALLLVALAGCDGFQVSDIPTPVVPEIPMPANVNGAWQGSFRFESVQGGLPAGAVTSGAATVSVFQNGAGFSSTWSVVSAGLNGSMSGTIDPDGNIAGTAAVTVAATPCSTTTTLTGQLNEAGSVLVFQADFFATVSACAGAPLGATWNLGR